MLAALKASNVRTVKLTWCRLFNLRSLSSQNSLRFINSSSSRLLKRTIDLQRESKVPQKPVVTPIDVALLPPPTTIDMKTIQLLEKLSLVNFANTEGIRRLEEAVRVADHLSVVPTDGVEPMISVLEEESLSLAEDEVTSDNMSEELLGCAAETLEDYFVVPPGNINFVPSPEYYESLKGDGKGKEM